MIVRFGSGHPTTRRDLRNGLGVVVLRSRRAAEQAGAEQQPDNERGTHRIHLRNADLYTVYGTPIASPPPRVAIASTTLGDDEFPGPPAPYPINQTLPSAKAHRAPPGWRLQK